MLTLFVIMNNLIRDTVYKMKNSCSLNKSPLCGQATNDFVVVVQLVLCPRTLYVIIIEFITQVSSHSCKRKWLIWHGSRCFLWYFFF